MAEEYLEVQVLGRKILLATALSRYPRLVRKFLEPERVTSGRRIRNPLVFVVGKNRVEKQKEETSTLVDGLEAGTKLSSCLSE
jgi:hypothetical protein